MTSIWGPSKGHEWKKLVPFHTFFFRWIFSVRFFSGRAIAEISEAIDKLLSCLGKVDAPETVLVDAEDGIPVPSDQCMVYFTYNLPTMYGINYYTQMLNVWYIYLHLPPKLPSFGSSFGDHPILTKLYKGHRGTSG